MMPASGDISCLNRNQSQVTVAITAAPIVINVTNRNLAKGIAVFAGICGGAMWLGSAIAKKSDPVLNAELFEARMEGLNASTRGLRSHIEGLSFRIDGLNTELRTFRDSVDLQFRGTKSTLEKIQSRLDSIEKKIP